VGAAEVMRRGSENESTNERENRSNSRMENQKKKEKRRERANAQECEVKTIQEAVRKHALSMINPFCISARRRDDRQTDRPTHARTHARSYPRERGATAVVRRTESAGLSRSRRSSIPRGLVGSSSHLTSGIDCAGGSGGDNGDDATTAVMVLDGGGGGGGDGGSGGNDDDDGAGWPFFLDASFHIGKAAAPITAT